MINTDAIKVAVAQTDLLSHLDVDESNPTVGAAPSIETNPEVPAQPSWVVHLQGGKRIIFKPTEWQIAGAPTPAYGELMLREKNLLSKDAYYPVSDVRKVFPSNAGTCAHFTYVMRDDTKHSFGDCDLTSPLFVKTNAGVTQIECVKGDVIVLDDKNRAVADRPLPTCFGGRDGHKGNHPPSFLEIDILSADEAARVEEKLSEAQ